MGASDAGSSAHERRVEAQGRLAPARRDCASPLASLGAVGKSKMNAPAPSDRGATLYQGSLGEFEEEAADQNLTPTKKRRTSGESIVDNARSTFVKLEESSTWKLLWDSKNRKREIAGRRSRLVNAGRRCGSLVSNKDARSLSQQLFDLAERLETRAAVIEKIRIDFVDFAAKSSPQEVAMLGEADGELICTIITTSLQGMIDKVVLSEGRILSLFFSVFEAHAEQGPFQAKHVECGPSFRCECAGACSAISCLGPRGEDLESARLQSRRLHSRACGGHRACGEGRSHRAHS